MSEEQPSCTALPAVLAGPILRRASPERVVIWLAARAAADVEVVLDADSAGQRFELSPGAPGLVDLAAGRRLHYLLIDLRLPEPLPVGRWIDYRIALRLADERQAGWQSFAQWAPDICYPGRPAPGFKLPERVEALLHGSCRKPHHAGADGLVEADRLLRRCLAGHPDPDAELPVWPSALVLSGDQIYADDVAGPMLRAIHHLLRRLELPLEELGTLEVDGLPGAEALYQHEYGYYRRDRLLPTRKRHRKLLSVLFTGAEKPVFTADNARNHLITLAEVLAMYLLVWSPAAWADLQSDSPPGLNQAEQARFASERAALEEFVAGLPAVRRLLAHIPVAMIFDDHDVSDDWNLNRDWEETAYGHPFSKRIIGNALIGYLINQGWGNRPEVFDEEMLKSVARALSNPGSADHDDAIDAMLRFSKWDYEWPTSPPLIVLDTRTRRWRSESSGYKPSGLLDWEALTDLQQGLTDRKAVLLVAPAPIFGVKLIESIQRLFTWFGKPLMVDAENWMAHPGTARGILNVFRHPRTPENFVVLSGDVHYSFVYDVELRGRIRGPDIWQICSSGLRNTFPERLLAWLDRLNRWIYSPRSPLNWLTRRRRMRVIPRKPRGTAPGCRLLDASGIGLLELDARGRPWRIRQFVAGGRSVTFVRRENESRWD